MRPARGVSFFRKIAAVDQIGSIVIPQQTVEKMTCMQGELLSVGEPEWCLDPDCKRPHQFDETLCGDRASADNWKRVHVIGDGLKPGAWVLLAPRSWVPTPERGLFAVVTDSILGVYFLAGGGIDDPGGTGSARNRIVAKVP